MKVSYYPGCSLEGTAKSYDLSARAVCGELGIALHEIPEWSCCGSSPALKMNRLLSVALSAHTMAQVAKQQLEDVVAPCPFCFRRLRGAQDELTRDPALKEQVERTIGQPIHVGLRISSLLEYMRDHVPVETLQEKLARPLKGLKVIPFYGCYLVKPPRVTRFDDPENPTSLDELLSALGAEVLDWDFKAECCGAGLALAKTEKVCELSGRLIREAEYRGADAIVVACQLCQANLDMRQGDIGLLDGSHHEMPILYFTQLMGLSFGRQPTELGLHTHLVDPLAMLANKGLI
ncbi:MAG: CoB--CoM heterodisulfide reductase iron-sulfur subunit B family protein [Thermodesulfobacteriota bacterium]